MTHSRNGDGHHAPIRLHTDAWGRLVATDAEGREHVGAETVRAFPISDPSHGISVCDANGRELAWFDDLASVPQPLRQQLEEDLGRRQFLPTIRRIVRIIGSSEPSEWEVETDRGTTTFSLKSEEDVRRLSDHGALIVDAHGVRYAIADIRVLDGASRRSLERYI